MTLAPAAIALLGPTAAGKTAAALAVAQHFEVEIISVDSALVYRGMDIGTAKPSAAERALVPHHLIDIRDPREAYSAAEFAQETTALVHAIRARGRLPLLVGGTMLYYKVLVEGMSALPSADPALRAELDADAARDGWPALHARLAQLDPQTAARLAPNDAQRIQRALEVCLRSGQPMSTLIAAPAQGGLAVRAIALEPSDRAVLHARIAERFDAMLEQGFLDEVRALRARGDLQPELPSMRSVGYRQAWEFLDGPDDAAARTALRERGIAATRQLAKRQLTWLRSLPIDERIDSLAADASARCLDAVARFAASLAPPGRG